MLTASVIRKRVVRSACAARRWATALLVAVLLAGGLAGHSAGAPVAAAAQGNQGLQGGWAIDNGGQVNFTHSASEQFPYAQRAGAGWVRINFRLGDGPDPASKCFADWTSPGSPTACSPLVNGRTALQVYDQVVNNARSNNLKILGLLSNESGTGGQNLWIENNAEHTTGTGENPYVTAFARNAGVLAAYFKGRVDVWEVWNEPNTWTSHDASANTYAGGTFLYPSNYAWLLRRSYDAIKAANPAATVIAGGLFAHEPTGASAIVTVDGAPRRVTRRGTYTERASAPAGPSAPSPTQTPERGGDRTGQGAQDAQDRAGATAPSTTACTSTVPAGADSGASYLCATYKMGRERAGWRAGASPFDDLAQHLYLDQGGATSGTKLTTYMKDLRTAYVAYEGAKTAKRLHITEVGWEQPSVGLDVQAQNLRTAYDTFKRTSYVARSYWFNTLDQWEADLYFGLFDWQYLAKPALSAYQSRATF
jgi:hypothetical protein